MPLQPFFRLVTFVALSLTLGLVALTPAFAEDEKPTVAEWETVLDFDSQIFPSYIISTATMKPDPTDEEENDSTVLGDQFGIIGIAITVPEDNTKVKVTVKKNKLMDASVWEGEIPKAGEQFFISPQIAYDYDALRKVRQQAPLNISLEVEIDGKPAGSKSATAMIHSINDCPFGVAHSEEMGEDNEGYDDLGWMFAAYVNESHPWIDKVLKDALESGVVSAFDGYQSGDRDQVLAQVYSIWNVLQKRGIKYSSITATPGGSKLVWSQHVRFLDECTDNQQANCVDGSVLFASILRKIGVEPFLVTVPGHMYLGVYLDPKKEDFIGLETTLVGIKDTRDSDSVKDMIAKLPEDKQELPSLKSFAAAVEIGSADLEKNAEHFADENSPAYQIIDVEEARETGVMPISYEKE